MLCQHCGIRVGLDAAVVAQTLEWTSVDMGVVRSMLAKDGVFWRVSIDGADPPPMKERVGIKAITEECAWATVV